MEETADEETGIGVGAADIGVAEQVPVTPSQQKTKATITGADGKVRPWWVGKNPVLISYYDNEWGVPVFSEQGLFEMLSLLVFQGGLRWSGVLPKRERLQEVFQGFDPEKLADTDMELQVRKAMESSGVIRNERKIRWVLQNAKATVALRENGGLASLVWEHQPEEELEFEFQEDLPSYTEESTKLAKALKAAGFVGVGPTTCFAFMQSVGVVDANPLGAYKRGEPSLWDEDRSSILTQ